MFNYEVNFIFIWTLINKKFLLLDYKINTAEEKKKGSTANQNAQNRFVL